MEPCALETRSAGTLKQPRRCPPRPKKKTGGKVPPVVFRQINPASGRCFLLATTQRTEGADAAQQQ